MTFDGLRQISEGRRADESPSPHQRIPRPVWLVPTMQRCRKHLGVSILGSPGGQRGAFPLQLQPRGFSSKSQPVHVGALASGEWEYVQVVGLRECYCTLNTGENSCGCGPRQVLGEVVGAPVALGLMSEAGAGGNTMPRLSSSHGRLTTASSPGPAPLDVETLLSLAGVRKLRDSADQTTPAWPPTLSANSKL